MNYSDRRLSKRYEYSVKAKIWHKGRDWSCQINDISKTGIGMTCGMIKMSVGDKISILLADELKLTGAIQWVGTAAIGLALDQSSTNNKQFRKLIKDLEVKHGVI